VQILDRRDCMKHVLTGLAALSGGALFQPVLGRQAEAQLQTNSRVTAEEFWKHVDHVKAGPLVHSAVNAARAGVQAQREVNASKRASILLGVEAGKEPMEQAHKQHELRTAELQKTKRALAEFIESVENSGETKFKEFLGKGGLKEALGHVRQSTIQILVKSDISPEEAETALKTLDDRLGKVQVAGSFHDLSSQVDRHLDELIEQKLSQEDPNPLCLLLLLITSLYVVLLIISILICVLLLGLVPCNTIFDQMIAQACP
jgi:signal recognition particle GTPase